LDTAVQGLVAPIYDDAVKKQTANDFAELLLDIASTSD